MNAAVLNHTLALVEEAGEDGQNDGCDVAGKEQKVKGYKTLIETPEEYILC